MPLNFFLDIVKKMFSLRFFLAQDLFLCTEENSCCEKNHLAAREILYCHYQEKILGIRDHFFGRSKLK